MNMKLLAGAVLGGLLFVGCTQGSDPAEHEAEKEAGMVTEHRSGDWSPGLSEAEKETLFAIAEDSLTWCVGDRKERFSFDAYTLTPKLKEPGATFVTLKLSGDLRGCIGTLEPVSALYRSVHDNAVSAALNDYRFRPLSAAERPRLEVHISILSPMHDIRSLDEFKIGEHGIILQKGPYRAVYLPEVAVEQHWSKEETLSSLSMKAGMDPDGWKKGTTFRVFSSVALSQASADEQDVP